MRETLTDRSILVTGGGGFIGSHIAAALAADNDVRVLDDFSSGSRDRVPPETEIIEGDLRNETVLKQALTGVDIVFHQAAMVSVSRSIENPDTCNEINCDGTVKLLDLARKENESRKMDKREGKGEEKSKSEGESKNKDKVNGKRKNKNIRVIVASSAAVYGQPDSVPISEDAQTNPQSPYGISKLAIDHYARRFDDLYDLETVVLRYFNVYGPRQGSGQYSAVIDVFREQARTGGPITVNGDGEQTRDFVHVSDVVRANCMAATCDQTGIALNVGTGETISIRELAERIRELTDSDAPIIHQDPRDGDIRHSCADISNAKAVLGYEPTVELASGLSSFDAS